MTTLFSAILIPHHLYRVLRTLICTYSATFAVVKVEFHILFFIINTTLWAEEPAEPAHVAFLLIVDRFKSSPTARFVFHETPGAHKAGIRLHRSGCSAQRQFLVGGKPLFLNLHFSLTTTYAHLCPFVSSSGSFCIFLP